MILESTYKGHILTQLVTSPADLDKALEVIKKTYEALL